MKWIYSDGGRLEAGFKGETRDCVTRAIAIATERPYKEIYNELKVHCDSSPRDGIKKDLTRSYLAKLGWQWIPTMIFGKGCQVHMRANELPKGRIIVQLSRHLAAIIDGVLYDSHDCSRNGSRCVYGYWQKV